MIPGNVELVQLVAAWAATVPTCAAILKLDERALSQPERERLWPTASRDATIFGTFFVGTLYGAVGLFVHFVRTRRSVRGVLLGLVAAFFLLSLDVGVELGTEAAIEGFGL